jgi:hypothetical protein
MTSDTFPVINLSATLCIIFFLMIDHQCHDSRNLDFFSPIWVYYCVAPKKCCVGVGVELKHRKIRGNTKIIRQNKYSS